MWNYGSMAVLAFVAGCLFYLQFRGLGKEEDELSELPDCNVCVGRGEEKVPGEVGRDAASGEGPESVEQEAKPPWV